MSGRFFNGSRPPGKSIAGEIVRLELSKKGKLSSADRFKMIMKRRLEESRKQAMANRPNSRPMSKSAEKAMKEMAHKKAAKEAKAMRRMVIVEPRTFPNGRLDKKGKIYDISGAIVAEVNTKNGEMKTMGGWSLGKYKPKSYFTNMAIQDAINKYSPYYINLRKMQAMQAGGGAEDFGVHGPSAQSNVYGPTAEAAMHGAGYRPPSETAPAATSSGEGMGGPRQNIGVTAWGAQSDNAWGTFTDNVWGTSTDNVWGGNSNDVWGGIGPSVQWQKSVQIWGTGSGKNYIKGLTSFLAAFFGIKSKGQRDAFRAAVASRTGGSGSSGRSGGSNAPTRTSRR